MSDRKAILNRLSSSLTQSTKKQRQTAVHKHIKHNKRGIIPNRTNLSHDGLIDLFMSEAILADATCCRVDSFASGVSAVKEYITTHNLKGSLWLSPQSEISNLNWGVLTEIDIIRNFDSEVILKDKVTAVNLAYGGVAETGSLAFISGSDLAMGQNFLNSSHIAFVRVADIVAAYEDLHARLRKVSPMPHSLTFVTGPSRTGDIAQTLEIGAHGALRLHIVLVDEAN